METPALRLLGVSVETLYVMVGVKKNMKEEKKKFQLTDRDKVVLKELNRWRFCLGSHVKELADFPSLELAIED